LSFLSRLIESGVTLTELLLAAGAVVLAIVLVAVFVVLSARQTKQRAKRLDRVAAYGELGPISTLSMRRQTAYSNVPVLDHLIRMLPNAGKLRDRLARTGYNLSIGSYLAGCTAIAGLTTAGLWFALHLPMAANALVGLMIGLGVPHVVTGILGVRRLNQFNALFPEAIDLIVRGLKSGLPVTESISIVGKEIKDPVGVEFRIISDSIKFGMSLTQALWSAAPRINLPEFRFFNITLSIQQETGGNLAETLENLSAVIRRRRQMKLKIKAFSSEAKASAYIIGSLPFIMFVLIMMVNYDYAITLFTDKRGVVMVCAGLLCYAVGIAVMVKMIRFEI
jgi:tight adherence protein B